jgi:hypothetical protein
MFVCRAEGGLSLSQPLLLYYQFPSIVWGGHRRKKNIFSENIRGLVNFYLFISFSQSYSNPNCSSQNWANVGLTWLKVEQNGVGLIITTLTETQYKKNATQNLAETGNMGSLKRGWEVYSSDGIGSQTDDPTRASVWPDDKPSGSGSSQDFW